MEVKESQYGPFLVLLFPSQKEELEKLSDELGRSQSQLVREAVTGLICLYRKPADAKA